MTPEEFLADQNNEDRLRNIIKTLAVHEYHPEVSFDEIIKNIQEFFTELESELIPVYGHNYPFICIVKSVKLAIDLNFYQDRYEIRYKHANKQWLATQFLDVEA